MMRMQRKDKVIVEVQIDDIDKYLLKGWIFPDYVDKLKGGKGDKSSYRDFDPLQIKIGVKIELEHGAENPLQALEITLDHLTEFDKYYYHLSEMESVMEKETKLSFSDYIKKIASKIVLSNLFEDYQRILSIIYDDNMSGKNTFKNIQDRLIDLYGSPYTDSKILKEILDNLVKKDLLSMLNGDYYIP